jgi:hypothetical protein
VTLRRFEQMGQCSLESLLLLVCALGRLNDFREILKPSPARSLTKFDAKDEQSSRRGTMIIERLETRYH